jgi:hypothetical protein
MTVADTGQDFAWPTRRIRDYQGQEGPTPRKLNRNEPVMSKRFEARAVITERGGVTVTGGGE